MAPILVAGGIQDPNVTAVLERAEVHGIKTVPLLIGKGRNPALTWDLSSDILRIDGEPVPVTAVFARRDVFHDGGPAADYRAMAWYVTLQGWLAASTQVRTLNRGYLGRHTNKLHVLRLAERAGLVIPETLVTNEVAQLSATYPTDKMIAKPVMGGGYSKQVDTLLTDTELHEGISASPAIVQHRLQGPDVRIYSVFGRQIGFHIQSDAVDYRSTRNREIELLDNLPQETVASLIRLMDLMGLDWCAADFKVDPESGRLTFLEINSDPMFSHFDRVSENTIVDGILGFLTYEWSR